MKRFISDKFVFINTVYIALFCIFGVALGFFRSDEYLVAGFTIFAFVVALIMNEPYFKWISYIMVSFMILFFTESIGILLTWLVVRIILAYHEA